MSTCIHDSEVVRREADREAEQRIVAEQADGDASDDREGNHQDCDPRGD
jgi:hypothetical protein